MFFLNKIFLLFLITPCFVYGALDKNSNGARENPGLIVSEKYPGVVKVIIPGRSNGTGVFVAPDILVTAFHIVEKLNKSIYSSGFFFSNSEVGFVNATDFTTIRNLDRKYDLAILKLKGYKSPVFYSLDSAVESYSVKPGMEVTIAGFPHGRMIDSIGEAYTETGAFLGRGYFGDPSFSRMDSRNGKMFMGMSGGPVFLNNRLLGINVLMDHHGVVFVSAEKIKKLLSKPDLSCSSASCIQKEKGNFLVESIADRTAQFLRGLEYMSARSYNQAVEWFRKSAEQNVYEAQFYIARLIIEGKVGSAELLKVISKDIDLPQELEKEYQELIREARYWLRTAAVQGGLSDASLLLGISYANGFLGFSKDLARAVYWYKKAFSQNHQGAISQMQEIINDKDISAELKSSVTDFLKEVQGRTVGSSIKKESAPGKTGEGYDSVCAKRVF